MANKVKRCPFCGGKAKVYWPNDLVVCIHCDGCKAEGPLEATTGKAIAKWNKRVTQGKSE